MTDHYLEQLRHQLAQTRAELRRAEDEPAVHRQRASRETRLRLAWQSARRRAAEGEAALTTLCASALEGLPGLGEPPQQAHECQIWEDGDGQWNVTCTACPEYRYDMGSEHDCEVWADDHAAAVSKP